MGITFSRHDDGKKIQPEVDQIEECLKQLSKSVQKISSILNAYKYVGEGILVDDDGTPAHSGSVENAEKNASYKGLKKALKEIQDVGISECKQASVNIKILSEKLSKALPQYISETESNLTTEANESETCIDQSRQTREHRKTSVADYEKNKKLSKELQAHEQGYLESKKQHEANSKPIGEENSVTPNKQPAKKKQKVSVQMYNAQSNDLIDRITSELKMELGVQASNTHVELNYQDCKTVADIHPETPVIVVCINASRLGTDVSGATKDLPYHGKTAIVVIHYKIESALPSQSSDMLLVEPEFQDLGCIVDIAFQPDTGIYPCKMNKSGLSQLIKFVQPQQLQHKEKPTIQ